MQSLAVYPSWVLRRLFPNVGLTMRAVSFRSAHVYTFIETEREENRSMHRLFFEVPLRVDFNGDARKNLRRISTHHWALVNPLALSFNGKQRCSLFSRNVNLENHQLSLSLSHFPTSNRIHVGEKTKKNRNFVIINDYVSSIYIEHDFKIKFDFIMVAIKARSMEKRSAVRHTRRNEKKSKRQTSNHEKNIQSLRALTNNRN